MPAEETDKPGAQPDLKAQFLQALERKKGQHGDGVSGAGPDAAKIHGAHSKVGGKRQFRRKSGG